MKKYNLVLGNPPYSDKSDSTAYNKNLWLKFIELSLKFCKTDGKVIIVHPNGWRLGGHTGKRAFNMLKKYQVNFVQMFSASETKKMFPAADTIVDFYVVRKTKPYKQTEVVMMDGNTILCDISTMSDNFIPSNIEIEKILAKNDEPCVEMVFSNSAYETRNANMNIEKTEEFKYPCINNLKDGVPELLYSNEIFNEKCEMFGIPKVVYRRCKGGVFIDWNGEYGLTQYCLGIVDDTKNFKNIAKALENDSFKQIIEQNVTAYHNGFLSENVVKLLKKDFWKEFV